MSDGGMVRFMMRMMIMMMMAVMVMVMVMMLRWMCRTRRQMMILRRKTDPKTRRHTLCEPAQSKRTWTCHKSCFVWNLAGICCTSFPRHPFCANLRNRNGHFVIFCRQFTGKMPDTQPTTSIKQRAFPLPVRTPSIQVWPHCLGKTTLQYTTLITPHYTAPH